MKRLAAAVVSLGLLAAACSTAEETTTTTATTTTITTAATTLPSTTTTTLPPTTTTTTEALATITDFAEIVLAGWEQRAPEGEPNEELYLLIYEFLIGDGPFAPEALEPEDALDAGNLYCIIHEGWIDTFGIDRAGDEHDAVNGDDSDPVQACTV